MCIWYLYQFNLLSISTHHILQKNVCKSCILSISVHMGKQDFPMKTISIGSKFFISLTVHLKNISQLIQKIKPWLLCLIFSFLLLLFLFCVGHFAIKKFFIGNCARQALLVPFYRQRSRDSVKQPTQVTQTGRTIN